MFAAYMALAGQQISSGIAKSKEADYNSELYKLNAKEINVQKGIEAMQYNRAMQQAGSTTMARTAKAGLEFSGSPAVVLADTLTQMEMDKAIGQYNLEVDRRNALATAEAYKRQGKQELIGGFSNAFTSILTGAAQSGAFTPKTYTANVGGKTVPVAPPNYYLRAGRL